MAKRKSKKKRPVEEPKPERGPIEIDPDVAVERQVPLNELPSLFPNSYEVVVAAARRARQLNLGLKPLVTTDMYRPVDVALAELAAGKVEYETPEEEAMQEPKAARGKSRSRKS
jgi:DNA-directed RNA polymerase omega subunit